MFYFIISEMGSHSFFILGIFGFLIDLHNWVFCLQRLGGLSYFAGAEKKDERVLVPDLGSLTSIYDRFVLGPLKPFPFKFNHFLSYFQ